MAENDTEDPIVVFELPDGTEVSNDPRWLAQRTLKRAGIAGDSNDSAELKAKIAELEAKLAEATKSDEDDDEDDSNEDGDEYDALKGADLKKLAADRNVDISGMTKVGQVRDALRAADKAAADANA